MKSEDFEKLTRGMATARTRRGLLAAFTGGLAAAALGSMLRPSNGQAVQYCTADSQCLNYERCAAGTCVGALPAYTSPTPAPPDAESASQLCMDACRATANACNDGCDSVAFFVRGTCWQRCRSVAFYCAGSCPPPPQPPEDDSQ